MNTKLSVLRGAVLALVFSSIIFTSCKKSSFDDSASPDVAGIMAFNLATEAVAPGFAITGNYLTSAPLPFNAYTGGYLRIFPGNRTVQAFDYLKDSLLVETNFDFVPSRYYSAFLLSKGQAFQQVIVHDNFDSLSTSTEAFVRYVNAIDDAAIPTVTITSGGNSLVVDHPEFGAVSEFKAVSPGNISIDVSNGTTVNVSRTISVEAQKVYTILLSGKPGAQEEKAVQIKFVLNGQVDAEAGKSSVSQNRSTN